MHTRIPLLLLAVFVPFADVLFATPQEAKGGDPKPGEERMFEVADGVKMTLCWIPAGQTQLGSPKSERDTVLKLLGEESLLLPSEAEEVRGRFKTKGFWLGKYEVTQEEWAAVMGSNPSYFDGKNDNKAQNMDTKRFPVDRVIWDECQKFLKKVNARQGAKSGKFVLPHEDEWEYACRGGKGNKQAFYWGSELNGSQANCDGNIPFGTRIAGAYLGRPRSVDDVGVNYPKHPWGLMHMHGNVWEMCENRLNESKGNRVLRGGSWYDDSLHCRAAYRNWVATDFRLSIGGLRVAIRLD